MTSLASVRELPSRYLAVSTAYDPAIVAQFKQAPGLFWDAGSREWVGPEEAMLPVLQELACADVVVLDLPPSEIKLRAITGLNTTGLYDYQVQGAMFIHMALHEHGAALLADSMGLGKSAQALRAAIANVEWIRGERALILSPAVVGPHWGEQCRKWLNKEAARLDGPATKKRAAELKRWTDFGGFGICSYDSFRSRHKELPPVKLIILDELHYLANAKAARSKAVRAYVERSAIRPLLIGLTGTPITARPKDMWHPLDLLFPNPINPKMPGRFGRFFDFGRRYCAGFQQEIPGLSQSVWDFGGASNLEELGARLKNGGLVLRRAKSEVLELPQRQRITIPVDLPEKAQAALARASMELQGAADSIGRVLSVIEEHKITAAVELAKDLLEEGRRVLIFTLRKASAKEIGEKLGMPFATGEDPVEKRVEKLRGSPCGVATIYSMTTGIDLTEFDTVIFVGLDWVPSTLLQAEARIHRIGSERDVVYYYLIGLRTVDEVVRSKVIERLGAFEQVMGSAPDEAAMSAALSGNKTNDDLLAEIVAQVMGGLS